MQKIANQVKDILLSAFLSTNVEMANGYFVQQTRVPRPAWQPLKAHRVPPETPSELLHHHLVL